VAGHLLQSLHRAGWTAEQRQVACCHPQRIAAVNAAAAAAADIGSSVGGSIGYSIAFEDIGTKVHGRSAAINGNSQLMTIFEESAWSRYTVQRPAA
jgi:hypothetical protein